MYGDLLVVVDMAKQNKNAEDPMSWAGSANLASSAVTSDNLASTFHPRKPMQTPGSDPEQIRVWADIPEDLQKQLSGGMAKIGPDCLKKNAETVLGIFEEIMLKHVLSNQIQNKALSRLMRGNPSLADDSDEAASTSTLAGKVARSSLLGRDPWGDEALPRDGGDAEEGDAVTLYTEVQSMLKSVQDQTWLYLTTHVKRILESDTLQNIVDEQLKYKADEDDIRTNTHRNRMPWSAYRDIILSDLPEGEGVYELQTLMALCRENGDTASRWLQRVKIGKGYVESKDITLPESLYVNLALRYLLDTELKIMAIKHTRNPRLKKLTAVQAMLSLRKLDWDNLETLVKQSLFSGGVRYSTKMHRHLADTRLFTLEQARAFLKIFETGQKAEIKRKTPPKAVENKRKRAPKCGKCTRAGLPERLCRHPENRCNDHIRQRNVRMMAERKSKKRPREDLQRADKGPGKPKMGRHKFAQKLAKEGEVCESCRRDGRPYRHSSKICNYAPGGAWHNKSGEELRALQKKYFENRKASGKSRHRTNMAVQATPFCREVESTVFDQKNTSLNAQLTEDSDAARTDYTLCIPDEIEISEAPSLKRTGHNGRSTPGADCHPGGENCNFDRPGVQLLVANVGLNGVHASLDGEASFEPKANVGPESKDEEGPEKAQAESSDSEGSYVVSSDEDDAAFHEDQRPIIANEADESQEKRIAIDAPLLECPTGSQYMASEEDNTETSPAKVGEQVVDDVIDLTGESDEEQEDEATGHSCHMMSAEPEVPAAEAPEEERTERPIMWVTIIPCGADGEPYENSELEYQWYMEESFWLVFDYIRRDYPIWGDRYRVIGPKGNFIKMTDKPQDLGYKAQDQVRMRLVMTHLPNAKEGYDVMRTLVRPPTQHSPGDKEEEPGRNEDVTSVIATNLPEAAKAEESEGMSATADAADEVITLHLWKGGRKCMTVLWGRYEPLRLLLRALAVIWVKPKHVLILMTMKQKRKGCGCIHACNTLNALHMPKKSALTVHFLPKRAYPSTSFLPSLADAWQILKTKGLLVYDQNRSKSTKWGGRGRKFKGRRKESVRRKIPSVIRKTKFYKHIVRSLKKPSKNKSESLKTSRGFGHKSRDTSWGTKHTPSMRSFSKGKISSQGENFSSSSRKRTRTIKLRPDSKIRRLSRSKIGELCTNSENSRRLVRELAVTFEPEKSVQEVSLSKRSQTGKIPQHVSKDKQSRHGTSYPKRTKPSGRHQNPNLTAKTQNYLENEKQRENHVFPPNTSDSAYISTTESDDTSETTSDKSDESETIYHPPREWKSISYPQKNKSSSAVSHQSKRYEYGKDTSKIGESPHRGKREDYQEIYCSESPLTNSDDDNIINTPEKTIGDENKREISSETTTDEKSSKNRSFVITKKNRKRRRNPVSFSETKSYRLLRTYLNVLDNTGVVRRVQAALDTQSNVSYAKLGLGIPRPWRSHENKYVKGVGGMVKDSCPLLTRVIKGGEVINLDTRSPSTNMFSDKNGPDLLLSAQHCVVLKIDMNKALTTLKHGDTPYLESKRSKKEPPPRSLKQTCFIAEKLMEKYLHRTGGTDKEPKQCSIEDVFIDEDFSPEQRRLVTSICKKYKDVFASSPDDIPPPLKDAKPHVFKMKEGCKPIYCKRPNWGPYQRKYLEQWTRKAIEQGLLEPAPDSEWASRPVLVGKYRGNTSKKDVPDGIRTCVDFTKVNEFIVKQPPQYTDPFEEIRRASGHKYYFEADGQKQFNSILLAEESRDITTTWTPLGLMRWQRLIMGTKDASGRAQMEYSGAMVRYLTDEARAHLANFQDDFAGFHNTIMGLIRVYEAFLGMCRRAGITLNPAKIRIGIRKCKFYGFCLSEKGMEPSEKNLDPVRKMTPPKNRSEVRSVMGVFNQFRHFFDRFDRLVLSIQKLLRKNEPFVWSEECNKGFEHIRQKLMEGHMYLASPDNTRPLILETDGSDDGWGAILLQEKEGKRLIIKMWSKQWKTLHMRRAPPYYKETKAWMNGLELARIYADYSPFPVKCITDHIPLTYVKNTSGKGPVSQFILDNLSSLDYTLTYRQGSKLVEADAVSRFPCIGPKTLATDGVKLAFDVLLATLPTVWTNRGRIWVYAQSETTVIQQVVRQWMSLLPKCTPARKVPLTDSPTADKIKGIKYSLGLWVPEADKAQMIVNRALDKKSPFACLIPSCLVNLIPETPQHQESVKECKKIVLLQPELTWILYGIPSIKEHQVLSISVSDVRDISFGNLNDFRGIVKEPPEWNFTEWVPLQEEMIRRYPTLYPNEKISSRASDGFKSYTPDREKSLVLVPPKHVKELVEWQHKQLCHGGHAKVHSALKKHWHWPNMKSAIRKIVTRCAPCQLLKAKRARAHRHFRAKVFCTPRTSWGCDFYGVAESIKKYNNILGAIDLATAECRLFACQNRSAEVVTDCILHGLVLRDGCPLHIHSDAAREFISKAMRRLCQLIGCQQTTTLAHHPTGNATIERLWQWIASCLRQMTMEQYKEWEKYVRLMEHVWNTSYHSVLQCTPFEAAHGIRARSAIDTLTQEPENTCTDLMTMDGVDAMRETARAFEQAILNLRQEAATHNAEHLRRGPNKVYKVGQEVSFYIPPSEKEANSMGRKPKHLLQYRGPAFVTRVLSNTTYEIEYEGRTYKRCFSELRSYKSDRLPIDLPIANHTNMQERKLIPGNYVALCDTTELDDDHFHLCEVLAIEDDKAVLLNYATFQKNIATARFSILYQERSTARYTTVKPKRNAHEQEVIDRVALEDAEAYIDHYNIRVTKNMRIKAKSIRQLKNLGLRHHILGQTYP